MNRTLIIITTILAIVVAMASTAFAEMKEIKSTDQYKLVMDDSTVMWIGSDWFMVNISKMVNDKVEGTTQYIFEYVPRYGKWYFNTKGVSYYTAAESEGLDKVVSEAKKIKRQYGRLNKHY